MSFIATAKITLAGEITVHTAVVFHRFLVEDLDSDGNFPDNLLFLLNHLTPLISSEHHSLQTTSFVLLSR